jgi:hypothetical protein
MVSDLRIVGDLVEGNKVAVTSTFSGGAEGPSRVQWFKTNTPHDLSDESTLEAISNSKVAKVMLLLSSALLPIFVASALIQLLFMS